MSDTSQNLNFDLFIVGQILRDVSRSTVTYRKSNLTSKSHTKDHQIQFDPTESTPKHERTINKPSTSKTKELLDKQNTRGKKQLMTPSPNTQTSTDFENKQILNSTTEKRGIFKKFPNSKKCRNQLLKFYSYPYCDAERLGVSFSQVTWSSFKGSNNRLFLPRPSTNHLNLLRQT